MVQWLRFYSVLPLQGARVQTLLRELRFPNATTKTQWSQIKKKKKALKNPHKVYGHTTLNAPNLILSQKLSRVGPG